IVAPHATPPLSPDTTLSRSEGHGNAAGGEDQRRLTSEAVRQEACVEPDEHPATRGSFVLKMRGDRRRDPPQVGDGDLGGDHSPRSEEHTSELQSLTNLVCRL